MPFLPPNQQHQSTEGISQTSGTEGKSNSTKMKRETAILRSFPVAVDKFGLF